MPECADAFGINDICLGDDMVSEKEQQSVIMGPKAAIWLVALTLVVGLIAWAMSTGPHQAETSYDQANQSSLYNAGDYSRKVPGGPSNQGALQTTAPAGSGATGTQTGGQ
jgi:hypothetical protein